MKQFYTIVLIICTLCGFTTASELPSRMQAASIIQDSGQILNPTFIYLRKNDNDYIHYGHINSCTISEGEFDYLIKSLSKLGYLTCDISHNDMLFSKTILKVFTIYIKDKGMELFSDYSAVPFGEDQLRAKICERELVEITGILPVDPFTCIVEYKYRYTNFTPLSHLVLQFSELQNINIDELHSARVTFKKYDDGWRVR